MPVTPASMYISNKYIHFNQTIFISLIEKVEIYNRIIQLYAIKIANNLHVKEFNTKTFYVDGHENCVRSFQCYTFKPPTLNAGVYLCIKVHYTNLSDLIMRAIIRAITVFTGLVVVVLRKCQHCPIVVLAFICIRFVYV